LWIVPDAAFGSSGAKSVGQIVATYGFWIASGYLAVLLIAELVSAAERKLKADS
jgi:hypothetical protein